MARTSSETQEVVESQRLFVDENSLARMIEISIRNVLEAELTEHLGAQRYERSDERRGQRNGTKPRTMNSRLGKLHFQVPQSRDSSFSPSVFDRYQRSERALVAAMQEMMVQGVSTRRVGEVLEKMAGFTVSPATVSRSMAELDEEIERFRNRPLTEFTYPYLVIDARYEKIRTNKHVVSQAVLVVAGITDAGQREILGLWVDNSESEEAWGKVFKELRSRGLRGVELVVSDAHSGIRAALARHFQGVAWQRCQIHLMRELIKKVSWRDDKELSKDLRAIFVSESRETCLAVAEEVAAKWEKKAPELAKALRAGIEDCLTVQEMPSEIRRRLRSTNMLERLMRSLKQRSQVVSIFPNAASCQRLLGAILLDIHEDWTSAEAKRYLNFDRLNP